MSPIVSTASSKHPTTSEVAHRESAGADPFSSRLMVFSTRGFAPRWSAQMVSTVEHRDLSSSVSRGARSAVSSAGKSGCRGAAISSDPSSRLLAASPSGDPLPDSRSARKTANALLPDP